MKMRFRSAIVITVAGIAAMGCSSDKGRTSSSTTSDSLTKKQPPMQIDSLERPVGHVARTASINRVVRVNGSNQVQPSDLIVSPDGFPVKFSTYKDPDTQMASMTRAGMATVTLTPVFGTTTNPDAFIQIVIDT